MIFIKCLNKIVLLGLIASSITGIISMQEKAFVNKYARILVKLNRANDNSNTIRLLRNTYKLTNIKYYSDSQLFDIFKEVSYIV